MTRLAVVDASTSVAANPGSAGLKPPELQSSTSLRSAAPSVTSLRRPALPPNDTSSAPSSVSVGYAAIAGATALLSVSVALTCFCWRRSRSHSKCGPAPTALGGLPPHWSGRAPPHDQGWLLVPPPRATVAALKQMLRVADPKQLGRGRDAHTYHREYSGLEFYTAWRVEHPDMWRRYLSEQQTIANRVRQLTSLGLENVPVQVQLPSAAQLPGHLNADANEVFLLSGTKPMFLLSILNEGLNTKLSALTGMLGAGIYLAEEAAKIDQYTTPDSDYEQAGLEELHGRIFRPGWRPHPGEDLFYALVVRATLGWVARTDNGATRLDSPASSLYHSDDKRELATIPGSSPPAKYNSLVAERGKIVKRFREFAVFSNAQCYVEYVIAYKRT